MCRKGVSERRRTASVSGWVEAGLRAGNAMRRERANGCGLRAAAHLVNATRDCNPPEVSCGLNSRPASGFLTRQLALENAASFADILERADDYNPEPQTRHAPSSQHAHHCLSVSSPFLSAVQIHVSIITARHHATHRHRICRSFKTLLNNT